MYMTRLWYDFSRELGNIGTEYTVDVVVVGLLEKGDKLFWIMIE